MPTGHPPSRSLGGWFTIAFRLSPAPPGAPPRTLIPAAPAAAQPPYSRRPGARRGPSARPAARQNPAGVMRPCPPRFHRRSRARASRTARARLRSLGPLSRASGAWSHNGGCVSAVGSGRASPPRAGRRGSSAFPALRIRVLVLHNSKPTRRWRLSGGGRSGARPRRARRAGVEHPRASAHVLRETGRARGVVFPHRGRKSHVLRETGRARGAVFPRRGRKSYVLRETGRARGAVFPRRGTGRHGGSGGLQAVRAEGALSRRRKTKFCAVKRKKPLDRRDKLSHLLTQMGEGWSGTLRRKRKWQSSLVP